MVKAVMDEELHALLGGSVSFNLKVTENITVTLAEWSRCPQNKVFVFSPGLGLSVLDKSYEGRLPTTLILSVGCGSGAVLLIGIAASVICCKRRRGFPVNSLLDKAVCQRNQNKSKSTSTKSDDEEQCDDIGYLEVTLP
ncbi:hypothetical protein DNTS_012095 [Danionella cerebrum]|uniref:Uncharacterized protein n=1 Tax=Danionella cerebrum TaxID=2873325 RepID=A0A553PVA2_9TELE|nr:hypothetical protein DNTS_012095 [Danionella translucida]